MNRPSEKIVAGDAQPSRLPTMLTLAGGYRVYDPAVLPDPSYHVDAGDGKIATTRDAHHGFLIIVFTLAVAVGAALLLGDTVASSTLWGVLGAGVGFLAAALVSDACSEHPERDYRRSNGHAPYVTVGREDDLAHRLCELADEIAATRTWRDGVVDPDRTLGRTAWAAARRALGVGRLTAQLAQESGRGAPDATLAALRDEIASTTADLERVRADLTEVATTARALDATLGSASAGSPVVHGDRPVEAELAEGLAAHTRALRDLL